MMKTTDQSPSRVLVTGGAGFLGAHLCRELLLQGHEVICLDSFMTGSRRNLRALPALGRFKVIQQDVAEPIELDWLDRIYNLACPASPPHYQADPVATVKTCVVGVLQVMELARRTGARVLQASTSEVYGDPQVHPQTESYWGHVNPIGPRACYDEGKRCTETLCREYAQREGVEVRVARIFNTYGPGMALGDGRVVSNFLVQALCGEPLTVYGTGSQTRSFCYVSDLIDGLLRLMESGPEVNGPVNLGNPTELSMLELADLVRELTGNPVPLVFSPSPADDPVQRRPDIRRAQQWLGWTPRVAPREGIGRTMSYFAHHLATLSRPQDATPEAASRPWPDVEQASNPS
ncbi:MAG: UDP-glucuronic acid decarboxylase family protein [Pigmentiphaga sp.]